MHVSGWRAGVAAVGAALAVAGAPARPDSGSKRSRPSDLRGASTFETIPTALQIYNDYVTPERTYSSSRAVVHYVVRGMNAPPLNDDDADGVPDYVQQIGQVADAATGYFEQRGFKPVVPDTGGPDARPDVYVSRFAAGMFGVAFPAALAEGGGFAVVANLLDPSSSQSLGSLYGTVAHELFHLVQFSYLAPDASPSLPQWVLEGSAVALERRLYPELDDLVWGLQLRPWLVAPDRGITRSSYGAALLWLHLDARLPRLLPALLARLASPQEARRRPSRSPRASRVPSG